MSTVNNKSTLALLAVPSCYARVADAIKPWLCQLSPAVPSGNVNYVDKARGLTMHEGSFFVIGFVCAISPWLRTPDYVRGGQLIA